MAKKIDYAKLFTLRKDGRYMGYWHDENEVRHAAYDKNPQKLYEKIQELEKPKIKTFGEIAQEWQEEHSERVSYNASAIYNAPLKQLCALWGDEPIESISPAMVQSLLNDMAKQMYAKRTVQVRLNALNQIFDSAVLSGYVAVNPCASVRLPSGMMTTKRELPSDNEIEIVKQSIDVPFGLFAYFILYSGLRRGELLALKWEDINFKAKTISVSRALYWNVNQPVIKDTKTDAGRRVVPLLQPLEEHLHKGKGFIFGMPTQTVYRRQWSKYQQSTGLSITPHQLRHAFATICFEAGIDEKDAQQLLGHASVSTTRDIYTHIREQRRKQTADKLNSFVVNSVVKTSVSIDNS